MCECAPLIARFMGPTWGPSGADSTQVGPMLAPWTLLSGSLIIPQHIETVTKWEPPRRRFQARFLARKTVCFDSNVTKVHPYGPIEIGSGNGQRQAIYWTNECLDNWCTYASFGLDDLTFTSLWPSDGYMRQWTELSFCNALPSLPLCA